MTTDDSTMTSLQSLMTLERERLEARRAEDAARMQAAIVERERHRAMEVKAAQDAEARAEAVRSERAAVEDKERSARAMQDLAAQLKAEHAAKMQAMDAQFAREAEGIRAKVQAQNARTTKRQVLSLGALGLLVVGLFVGGAQVMSQMEASTHAARAQADAAERALLAARNAPTPAVAPVVQVAPVALPVAHPIVSHRTVVRHHTQQTQTTQHTVSADPFHALGQIDNGPDPVNSGRF